MFSHHALPKAQGLYDPILEKDSCGVGFAADIKGRKSHRIIEQGLEILLRLSHRGACGCDPKTGDGAGILMQLPHEFIQKSAAQAKIKLPNVGRYAVGLVFLPRGDKERSFCESTLKEFTEAAGQTLLGWRDVPTDNSSLGETAKEVEPIIRQVFIGAADNLPKDDVLAFERKLYLIRRQTENKIRTSGMKDASYFYIPSLSARTICYKGLLMPEQLPLYFPDLSDSSMVSALALVHSRYSTNTFPTWDLSHPFRYLAHNGEINTLRGNLNWMRARESLMSSPLFGDDLKKLFPILTEGASDSAILDNAFELLILSGRSLPHAMMMMIPEAWSKNIHMDEDRAAFYEYHATMMEPWDGPAAVAFTDGTVIGATLDRNGLRPARYIVTTDDMVVMASEVGVQDIPVEKIKTNGRLQPGRMFLIDTAQGRIISDEEIKNEMAHRKPYKQWLSENKIDLDSLPEPPAEHTPDHETLRDRQKAFGYTMEDIDILIQPMALKGEEPTGSMGNDTPLAILSNRSQLPYNYFKQLFAQVTNPPIDPIREELVMSLESYIGKQLNLLDETPKHCHQLKLPHPILANRDLEKLRHVNVGDFKTVTLSLLFDPQKGPKAMDSALSDLCSQATKAVKDGYSVVILSDRGVDDDHAAIPALLAMGAVHHHLVRQGNRNEVGIILETAEPREVMHFALLFGFGANAVNPYLVFETISDLKEQKELPENTSYEMGVKNFIKAIEKGLLKTFSKMGISTLQSYRGAQIFEAVGLNDDVIERCFAGTTSRIKGANFTVLSEETIRRHKAAYPAIPVDTSDRLPEGGAYQFRRRGERHLWNAETIATLQHATRYNDQKKFDQFAAYIDNQDRRLCTLRGLFTFKKGTPISLDEVEPASEIVKRFATGAMSFGSISKEAHETMAIAMNRLGGRSNTGEGGEDPVRFATLPNGDSKRSSIKQIASGRFGVTTEYLVNADEIQIKMAQGAKPGEGGQLPGHKVDKIIAKTRHSTPGVTLISPPPHHDIYSIEDLAQLIFDLKNVNPRARISVKLVSEVGVGTVAAGVAKAHSDMILISGHDGGTGASPLSSIKHAGLPWELGLSETQQTLVLNDLRGRVRLQTDGQLRTGRDVVIAALLGAEEYGFSTAALIVMGCVMMRKCHMNTCPVGIATQDPELRAKFLGKADFLVNYFTFVAEHARRVMAELGFKTFEEMIGRVDMIESKEAVDHWKAQGLDFSRVLYRPQVPDRIATHCVQAQDHNIDQVLDRKLIETCQPAIQKKSKVKAEFKIKNVNRTTGAMLSGEIASRYGMEGLPEDTIEITFNGNAGQSFGAWLAHGVTFRLNGDSNDYVGKGISGGKLIIRPPKEACFTPEENIIVGNTCFYGAIKGEAYIRGMAGERFCVRNSGVSTVIEGVGDHGCEYMTGGRVVVLGPTGRNFAAGMSGGVAYVLDETGAFESRCNKGMIEFEAMDNEDISILKTMIENHLRYTDSTVAKRVLGNWEKILPKFIKIMPTEYKKILASMKKEKAVS